MVNEITIAIKKIDELFLTQNEEFILINLYSLLLCIKNKRRLKYFYDETYSSEKMYSGVKKQRSGTFFVEGNGL